jgi:hypothetical protein
LILHTFQNQPFEDMILYFCPAYVMHVLLTNFWQNMGRDILDRKFARRQDWDSRLLYSDDIEQPDDNHEDEKRVVGRVLSMKYL